MHIPSPWLFKLHDILYKSSTLVMQQVYVTKLHQTETLLSESSNK